MICPFCGEENVENASFCFLCGSSLNAKPKKASASGRRARAAGYLILISGVLGVLNGIYFLSPESLGLDPTNITWIPDLQFFGYMTVAAGLAGVLGGVFSISRTNYPVCLAGGFLAALSLGFSLGFFIGVAGMVIVGFAKRDFEEKEIPGRL